MEDEDIEEMLAFADKNCDGKLSYSEFEVTMTNDQDQDHDQHHDQQVKILTTR